jgi:hypothetical protein
MKLRLHGIRVEVAEATCRRVEILDVVAVRPPYPDRRASALVRVYLEVRIDPTGPTSLAPARPAWPARYPRSPRP